MNRVVEDKIQQILDSGDAKKILVVELMRKYKTCLHESKLDRLINGQVAVFTVAEKRLMTDEEIMGLNPITDPLSPYCVSGEEFDYWLVLYERGQ